MPVSEALGKYIQVGREPLVMITKRVGKCSDMITFYSDEELDIEGEKLILVIKKALGVRASDLVLYICRYNFCIFSKFSRNWAKYNRWIWFGLVGVYGIWTVDGNLMPNLVYTCTSDVYDL